MQLSRTVEKTEKEMKRKAFTLIELLVVIAIIAILAAILFPVFAKARENAKKTKSLNNIRQLAVAVQSYANDYQETFPGWVTNGNNAFHNVWDEQIEGNIKSKDVYNNGDPAVRSPSQPAPYNRVLSYGLNGLLITAAKTSFDGNADWRITAVAPSSAGAVANPSGTILFAELHPAPPAGNYRNTGIARTPAPNANNSSEQFKNAPDGWIDIDPKAWIENNGANSLSDNVSPPWGIARDLYGGGGVYGMVDGSAKFMKIIKTITGGQNIATNMYWNANNPYNMWNPN